MKLEFNRKRILIEAENSEEEKLIEEVLGQMDLIDKLKVFLGLEYEASTVKTYIHPAVAERGRGDGGL